MKHITITCYAHSTLYVCSISLSSFLLSTSTRFVHQRLISAPSSIMLSLSPDFAGKNNGEGRVFTHEKLWLCFHSIDPKQHNETEQRVRAQSNLSVKFAHPKLWGIGYWFGEGGHCCVFPSIFCGFLSPILLPRAEFYLSFFMSNTCVCTNYRPYGSKCTKHW